MRRRLPYVVFALAVSLSACAQQPPIATQAARTDALSAQAATEASRDVASLVAGPVSAEDSGLSRAEFSQHDRDRDGRLDADEQLAVFRQVWQGVQAIAKAKRSEAPGANGGPADTASYKVPHPLKLTPSQAEVYIDAAEVMPAIYQTIQSARSSVWLDVFLLGGAEGLKISELLVAKMNEGVDVRVIHDPNIGFGGVTGQQIVRALRYLQGRAVPLKMFPITFLKQRRGGKIANKFMIDHNKYLVVDRSVAMIGTMNMIDIGTMNHDVFIRLDGGAAEELAAIHEATWKLDAPKTPDFRRLEPTPGPAHPLPESKRTVMQALGETAYARVTKTDIDQRSTKPVLMELIKNAKRSIHIAIYDYSDMDVTKALIQAYKRGVDVKVLSDKHLYFAKYVPQLAALNIYGMPNLLPKHALRDAGVPVKWFVPQVADQELHMKVAIFDGERAIVGSTNFTYQAFENFRETGVDILGGQVPPRLEKMFASDWEKVSEPVTKATFKEKCFIIATKYMDKFNLSWW